MWGRTETGSWPSGIRALPERTSRSTRLVSCSRSSPCRAARHLPDQCERGRPALPGAQPSAATQECGSAERLVTNWQAGLKK